MKEAELVKTLLTWYDEHRRILPWREDPTPFHVWISEIMLQQTRVEAVLGYYERFLNAIPDIPALARTDDDTILKLWEGLGYYSRARNLKKAAVRIMDDYGGHMPSTAQELRKLPGIGEYTSAAIAAIAFGENEAAIDGNLLRIFSRMTEYGENIKAPEAKKAAEDYFLNLINFYSAENTEALISGFDSAENAEASTSRNITGDFNQALMDLGATICLSNAAPKCGECPWKDSCKAHRNGRETDYPITPAKKEKAIEEKTVLLIRYNNQYVLHRRPQKGLLAGLYEFPLADGHLTEDEALKKANDIGFKAIRIQNAGKAKHIFTHKEWHMIGYEIIADELQEPFVSNAICDAEAEDQQGYFLASKGGIEDEYAIPSALIKYKEYLTS